MADFDAASDASFSGAFKNMINPDGFRDDSAPSMSFAHGRSAAPGHTKAMLSEVEEVDFAAESDHGSERGGMRRRAAAGSPMGRSFDDEGGYDPRGGAAATMEMVPAPSRAPAKPLTREARWRNVRHRYKRLNKKLGAIDQQQLVIPDERSVSLDEAEENIDYEEREYRMEQFKKKGRTRIVITANIFEKGINYLNRWFNVPIKGWSEETLIPNMEDFDDALERLHDQLDGKVEMPPMLEIIFLFVMSAVSHVMMQMTIQNPAVQRAIQNELNRPEVAAHVARGVVSAYDQSQHAASAAAAQPSRPATAASHRAAASGGGGMAGSGIVREAAPMLGPDDDEDAASGPWGGGPAAPSGFNMGAVMDNIDMGSIFTNIGKSISGAGAAPAAAAEPAAASREDIDDVVGPHGGGGDADLGEEELLPRSSSRKKKSHKKGKKSKHEAGSGSMQFDL